MKNIIKSFSITLIFLISLSKSITIEELWDYTTKKIKKDDRYFIIDPDNKLSESEIKKIEESSNAIFMRYGINTHLFIINEVNEKDLFIRNLILKLNDKIKKNQSNTIFSIVIIKENYYYLSIGSEIQLKVKEKEIDKVKEESIKLGYEKYIRKDKGFGSYVLTFLLICTICIVGIYVVHNYRRKLLKKKISVDIDYKSITEI